jgi:pilus assembly protein CpaC
LSSLLALAIGETSLLAQAPGSTAQEPEVHAIGVKEKITVRSRTGKAIRQVVVAREKVISVAPVDPMQPSVLQITGEAVGETRVTLVTDPPDEATYLVIRVVPDLSSIQAALARQFPLARVTLTSAGTGVIIIAGYVDAAEDVDAIVQFVQGYGYRLVVNHIKVGGVQQVQLEVCVAQVNRTELRQLGFNFLTNSNSNYFGSTVNNIILNPDITAIDRAAPIGLYNTPPVLNDPFVNPQGANLFFGLITARSSFLGFIDALRTENLIKDLANPSLVTLSGRPATFTVGGEQPFGTAGAAGISGGGGAGISFKEFGTRLTFLPIVLGDGRIRLEIETEVSGVSNPNVADGTNVVAPSFATTRLHNTVELGNGETLALGGLIQTSISGNTVKTPIIGDVPFFGALFRRVVYSELEREYLIIVTPRLVDPLDCSQRVTKLPGQETRTPTDFELFLEGILEAPRGPRELCPDGCYRAAHWWSGPFCDPPGPELCPGGRCGGVSGGMFHPGCSGCSGGVQTVPMGATTRPEAMPPMATPADATQPHVSKSSVTRAVLLTAEPAPTPAVAPNRPAPVFDGRPSQGGAPTTVEP